MRVKTFPILFLSFLFSLNSFAEIKLPRLISDNMVLQRATEIKIWGWADPSEKISLQFNGLNKSALADKNGNWEIMLPSMNAGGPYNMKLSGENSISLQNIMLGDVWICGGQSNMETTMERVSPLYEKEIKEADDPNIRYFYVPRTFKFGKPLEDFENGSWQPVSQENILGISAVPYFFAKEIYAEQGVAIGLINNALGGSPAEAWVNEEALKKFPHYLDVAKQYQQEGYVEKIRQADAERQNKWYRESNEKDAGHQGPKPWHAKELNTSDWATMEIPGYWADGELGNVNGVVWFRKEIEISAAMAEKPAKLLLGRIVDADSTFVNGVFVGNVTYQYPPRRYEVPANVLKEGKNTLAVKVVNNSGRGGFFQDKPYELIVGDEKIDLKGEWKYKLGTEMPPLAPQTFIRWKPTGLYNAMLYPLFNYKIKGVIWYQGEANTRDPQEYEELFPTLIKTWREGFGQGNFPFLFVQLHNFMKTDEEPTESNWAALREAQRKTLFVPNTAMAVAIDVGEWNDIHPLNKKDVGKRLALAAKKLAYGRDGLVYSGPLFESMRIKGKKAIVSFSNVGSGLVTKDGGKQLKYFSIAGSDGIFVWAKAKIKGNKVIVCSNKIARPASVRYAWANNPEGANLYNKEGLPASPFQTN